VRKRIPNSLALGVSTKTKYIHSDLFDLSEVQKTGEFDVVNSLGVLHHAKDCPKAFEIAASMIKPGGYINLGLYHHFGRQALLREFEGIRKTIIKESDPLIRERVERQGFEKWKRLFNSKKGKVFEFSWYRDQCLHPHETQWTLREVLNWMEKCGVTPLATSLNRFDSVTDWKTVCSRERDQLQIGYQKINEGIYFPGFFVIWGRKN